MLVVHLQGHEPAVTFPILALLKCALHNSKRLRACYSEFSIIYLIFHILKSNLLCATFAGSSSIAGRLPVLLGKE